VKSIDLFRFLTSDLQLISRRKPIPKIFQFGFDRSKTFPTRGLPARGKHNIEIGGNARGAVCDRFKNFLTVATESRDLVFCCEE